VGLKSRPDETYFFLFGDRDSSRSAVAFCAYATPGITSST
jgi:hypothetical protein